MGTVTIRFSCYWTCWKLSLFLLKLVPVRSPSGNIWLHLPQWRNAVPVAGHLKKNSNERWWKHNPQLLPPWVPVQSLFHTAYCKKQSWRRFPMQRQSLHLAHQEAHIWTTGKERLSPVSPRAASVRLLQSEPDFSACASGTKLKFWIKVQPHGG